MKILNLTLISAIILLFVYLFVRDRVNRPKLMKEKGVVLNAWTLEWAFSSKGGRKLKYEFFYQGEKIIRYEPFSEAMGNINFVHKYFPVIYEPKSGNTDLLVEPKMFLEYGIPIPDSLNWVLDYFDK
jgi:uncharacterized SAM-binding protein YcdF (DUF218 family)